MKVSDLLKIEGLELMTKNINSTRNIKDIYTSDLLSWVMGHIREDDYCLLTVLNSINVIAVAVLLDLSAIVFCDGVIPSDEVIKKAEEENIPLFTSQKSSAHVALDINQYESLL